MRTNPRFQSTAGDQIDLAPGERFKFLAQRLELENPDARVRGEFNHEVEIAARTRLAARNRAEDEKLPDAVTPAHVGEFGCVDFGLSEFEVGRHGLPFPIMIEPQQGISTVARTGAQSLRVTTPIVDRGVYQEVKDLVPGRTYEFRAWVRAESGTTLAALAVCDPNYNAFVWTGVQTVGTAWQMLSVTFTANSMGVARVHLAKHDITGAQLWDDVELVNGATAVKFVRPAYYPYGQEMGTATENVEGRLRGYHVGAEGLNSDDRAVAQETGRGPSSGGPAWRAAGSVGVRFDGARRGWGGKRSGSDR